MKACNNCPFYRKNPLEGAPSWLRDLIRLHRENEFFRHTCHKTDPNADGYNPKFRGEPRECVGHLTIMINKMDGTPGKGGVYTSIKALVRRYYGHFSRELDRREKAKRA